MNSNWKFTFLCPKAPHGWQCQKREGHAGSCAAVPRAKATSTHPTIKQKSLEEYIAEFRVEIEAQFGVVEIGSDLDQMCTLMAIGAKRADESMLRILGLIKP